MEINMSIEVFNRFEHKYILDDKAYDRALKIIDRHMTSDSHNQNGKPYTIANIYYDTNDDILIRRSLSSPMYKEKLRLRAYGAPNASSEVFLEIKKKCNGLVNKRRTTLKLKEAYDFVSTGIQPEYREYMNKQVLNEIEYFLKEYELEPKVYIAYDRIAYFENNNPNLRISFDSNIRTRRRNVCLEKGDYGSRLLTPCQRLMEIKTFTAYPLWLADMLSQLEIRRTHFSKYGTEFKNRQSEVLEQAI